METEVLWNHFLEIAQRNLSEITFETWFKEAKLIELEENTIKILVPDVLHKKHLKENYNDMVEETFNEITGSNFKIEYLLEEEVKTNVKINTDENYNVSARYGIMSIPTLGIFKNGQLVDSVIGAVPKQHLISKIKPFVSEVN